VYDLRIDSSVDKELRKYPPKHYKQVMSKILSLRRDPRPADSKDLKGGGYRATQGEYRILYTIDYENKVVTIFKVGKRDAVYKNL
jgi:mRNA interferase RelE/StbE